jgi:insulysin
MNVSVGCFSDPDGLEGLAHFLGSLFFFLFFFLWFSWRFFILFFWFLVLAEHMLFYASEKYPLEDSYSKYIIEVINYLIII